MQTFTSQKTQIYGLLVFVLLLMPLTSMGQQADLRNYVTEGQDCTSNDVQLVSARLDSEGCTSCSPGDVLLVDLLITIKHNTNSNRPALAVFGDLTTTYEDGSSTTNDFIECGGPIIPKGQVLNGVPVASGGNGVQTINYGQVSYVCGSTLEVDNILVTWTVPSDGECPIADANPHPKCGFQEGTLFIIPPLQASAEAFCSPENLIDLTPLGGTTPYNYVWTGPNGFASTSQDISEAAPGNYQVTVTDSEGCSVSTSVIQEDCCEFYGTGILDPTEISLEGCDTTVLPQAFTDPLDAFENITPIPCGELNMIYSDTVSGDLCPDGLSVLRTYTLFDDLNNNQIYDTGEEAATSTQNFRIMDSTDPEFVEALPADITVECDEIPQAVVLTANDNCDSNVSVVFEESQNSGSCPQVYTLTRTWTATDACNNETTHVQTIEVLDSSAPIFNETLPENTVAAYDNIPSPEILTASDSCDSSPQVLFEETYNGDETSTTYTIIRTWTAEDCAGNTTEHIQRIFVTENGDPIGLAIDDISINEDAGIATLTVSNTGEVAGGFTVNFASADGTAGAPIDYISDAGSLNFNGDHGQTRTIDITINDDLIAEAQEAFSVNLTAGTNTPVINKAQGTITINDNDSATITITDVDVDEAIGNVTVVVTLNGAVEESFVVDYSTADGTAEAGTDYTTVTSQINWPANAVNGSTKNIIIPITNDNVIEFTENFLVDLTNILASSDITFADDQANVNILDNDAGDGTGIDFDATSVTVDEGAGTATFTVRLTGDVQGGFSLDYATADGSAAQPGDYTTTAGTFTFAGTDGESYEITVPIIDDSLIENTEDFFVDLSNLSTTLIGINTPQATGNITDNDAVVGTGIDFDATSVTVDEAAGTATFTVILTGDVQGGFTLDYATADNDAAAPGDYTTTSGTLTFVGTDGESFDITVPIIDDSLIENTEDFFVDLSNLSTTLIGINTPQATGNITDNDAVDGTGIDFDATSVTVDEGAGTATFTVRLTGDVQGGFTLDYATADGSAAQPDDYTTTAGSLTFAGTDGESYEITVPIIDDSLIENTEDFFVDLSNLSTTLIGINTPQATGNITDNDAVDGTGIDFDATSVTVDEGAGTATFTVRLTGDVQGGFTLDYATADNDAAAPGDYTTTSGTLNFVGTDGESYEITVPIIDDSLIENTEDFFVDLSNLSTTLIGINTPQATGNITDNDAGDGTGIDFDATSVTVDEAAGTATFTVILTGDVQGGFSLDYATADNDAAAPGDYTTTSGTLNFVGTDGESYEITVPIIDDSLIENTEDFFVDLSNLSTTLIGINTPQAVGNITDNDAVVGTGIDFDATSVTVDESAGTATFTVILTGDVQGGFTLDYATADNDAAAPGDYTTTSGTLTFAGNDGEFYDITVPIIDDSLIENTEDFFVDLSNLSTTLIGINTPQATGNITDNDAVVGTGIDFDATSVTVDEAAGTATFTVILTGDVQGGFTLDYATADGSAAQPDDYTTTSGTLNFAGTDGESYEITVPIIDDSLIENTEDFFVDLSNLSTTLIGINTPQATGNITDNDAGDGTGIDFDATSVTVDEAAGTATFTVILTGDVQGGFSLDYATADGSAAQPGDYTTTSGTLNFAGTDGESYEITVPIIDDSLIENTEDFFVDLSNLSTTLIGINTPQATGNITDNDAVVGTGIDFDATSVTVDEAAGTATFTVILTGDVQGGFTLDYATADGSAAQPGDYTTTSGTLTFVGTDGESYDITVPIIDDSLIENTEDFFVDLSNLSTTLIGINTPQATGNITDNDAGDGTGIDFDATSVTVDEAAGTATFTVILTGDVQGGFSLDYATADNDAAAPGDYTTTAGTLNFVGTDGESYEITVPIIDDSLIENTEDFFVDLSNLSTTLIGINTPQATGNITDNDAGDGTGIDFDATSVTVDEAAGTATFTVILTGDVQGGFTLDYATADGSAAQPGDYTTTAGTLTFAGTDGESYEITVPIIDDSLIENTEDFFVDLSNLSTTLIGINTPQATGNITDNDAVVGTGIDFDATSVTVDEGAGTATFTVRLTGDVQGGFSLDYATADNDAAAPGDYTTTSGTLNFVGTDGESYEITVPIIDDSLIENTEDFFVDLSNLSTTLIGINTPQAVGNITDNDAVVGTGIDFDATSVTVDESAGTATFTVILTGDVQGGFTLDYATADNDAAAPGDYTTTSGTLTFAGNDGEFYDITVPIIDDSLIENTEDFFVDLSNLSTTLIGINTPQATGNITDNDAVVGTGIDFDATSVTVDEAAGTATFTVILTGDVQGGFTLDYATADGSAAQPDDYTTTSGTLNFAGTDGESYEITVPIIDDSLIENTEDFFVDLSNLSTTLIGINTPQATGNITDNDAGDGTGIDFDATSVTVDEAAGTATFTVILTGDVQGGFSLDYATADGSAAQPGDYTTTSGTLNFAGTDGESYEITVPIIDDSLIENTEDFFVDLSNLSTTLIGINTPQATGNITDNDAVVGTGIDFDATSVTVDEAAGTATFTVILTGDVQGGFSLDYATADGSAAQPGDYTTTSGTLNFVGTDGESYEITVPIIDDSLIENTEDFFVDLSNLSTTLIGINTPQATGNITDNDAGDGTGIDFDATSVTVDEAAGTATFTVILTGDVQGGFSLDYATADNDAAAPGDYTTTAGTLNFVGTDGESYEITVPIIDDVIIEDSELFSVNLSNLSHSAIGINTPTATGTILDNDSEDDFPSDTTMQCEEVPFLDDIIYIGEGEITLNANGCEYVQEYNEVISGQDDECYTEYIITRTWTITDCVDNVRTHTQIITVLDTTAPVFVESLPADMTVSCDAVPTPAEITAMDNCDVDVSVTFTENITGQDDECASEYTITRTWVALDCAGNSTSYTQVIIVEDVIAPVFVEELPENLTTTCSEVPDAVTLTAIDNCDPNITVTFDETITNDANCANGYTITRTWSASDCAGNAISHTQVITIPATGPITSSDYDEEVMIICGEDIPEVPELTFMGGCGDYTVVFNEETQFSEDSDDYMIIRIWDVTDACGNTESFEQLIFVMQPQLETVFIDICVEDPSIDLVNYLPASFDTNGTFEILTAGMVLNGSILDPLAVPVGEYQIAYSSTEGTCKYYVDFTITVNADCVPCGVANITPSKTVTPNGDGVNDVFEIKGVEFCNFNFDLMIFNRWGAKVYEEQNYQNDWGGNSPNNSFGNSGMLPAGTYYYIIKVTNKDFEPVNGYIYLGSN